MARVFVGDSLHKNGLELLEKSGLEVDARPGLEGAELSAAMQAADAMIVRSKPKVTADLLAEPGKLRAVIRAGVGVDNIDVGAATKNGIVVMNTPDANTISTAEHTICMMMALARNIPQADASLKSGKWDRKKFMGTQLAGKTLGIVGLGRIGREVAKRALGMEMKVVGYDPFVTPEKAKEFGIEAVGKLEELMPVCDFLTVHTPGGPETLDMIGETQIALLPKGSRILNCARGGIVNEEALAAALESGHLAGAGLDVFSQEPPPEDSPLLKFPNVVAVPHLGASTTEAQEKVACEAALLAINYLKAGEIPFAINAAPLDQKILQDMKLYVDMARRLGLLHAQMCRGSIQKAVIKYRGEVTEKNTKLLTAAFTAGLLEAHLDQNVNVVNAGFLAKDRGIEVVEHTSSKIGDFSTLISVDVTTDQKTYTAAATLFGNQYLRLVRLGAHHLDAIMDGILFLFTHRDIPGLIGFIGTIFGKHKVNIAQMTVGRQQPGGEAIAVLNLDSFPPEEAVKEVQAHEAITSLCVVKLPGAGEMPDWLGS
ncbi:MAG: phosphoglycerate dehydrogenase [Gemmataceae bacterium]